jgi:hypothetical protein
LKRKAREKNQFPSGRRSDSLSVASANKRKIVCKFLIYSKSHPKIASLFIAAVITPAVRASAEIADGFSSLLDAPDEKQARIKETREVEEAPIQLSDRHGVDGVRAGPQLDAAVFLRATD